jgi:predicted permease
MLRKQPGSTLVAVLSLAVGIGLNSTVFSLINQTSLQDLPVHEPQRVFTITGMTGFGGEHSSFNYLDREDFLDQCPSFADVLVMNDEAVVAQYRPTPGRLHAKIVSRNYFSFFGLRPALGRFFMETDDQAVQDEPAVVISYSLWQRDFGRDPSIVGRTIQLDSRRATVFGVAPKGFVGTNPWAPADVWLPAPVFHSRQPRMLTLRSIAGFALLVRARPGSTLEAAESEAKVVTQRLAQAYPSEMRTRDARLSPLTHRRDTRYYLAFLANMLLPGAVLALACANVCALLIARAQSRTREIAARLALGSSRARLVRQMLVESMLLSVLGGAGGLLLAQWTIGAMPSLLPPAMFAVLPDLYVDGRMLIFTAVLSVLTTFLFGLWPAWQATRPALMPLLKSDAGFGFAGRRFTGLRRIVTGQLVVSLVLLCVASLFLRSLLRSLGNHPGIQRPDLLVVELNPREYGIELPRIQAYVRQVRERLAAMPGVRRVSVAGTVPLEYNSNWSRKVFLPRGEAPDQMRTVTVPCNVVDERLLDLMGWRLLSGRTFTPFDDESSSSVTVVSQAAAQAFWPDRNPVGQVIRIGEADGQASEVIGVAADGPYNFSDGRHQPYFFFPVGQAKLYGTFVLLMETRGPPRAMVAPVREALRSVDERVLPVSIQTLHDSIRASQAMFGRQFLARFFMLFGLLGLLLASIGLYAVVAYTVGRRTQEIGIRMAMGATRAAIARLVLREGLCISLIGIAVGLPIAFGIAQLLRNGLYGFPPADPLTFIAVPLLLAAVALLACWLPARRAARVDPMAALRYE